MKGYPLVLSVAVFCWLRLCGAALGASNDCGIIYPWSWPDGPIGTTGERVRFESCDSLWDIATYLIDALYSNGWTRIGGLSWQDTSNEGYDWGGIFEKDGVVLKIDAYGPWSIGALSASTNGATDRYVPHAVHYVVYCGTLDSALGPDWSEHSVPAERLQKHLEDTMPRDGRDANRLYAPAVFEEIPAMERRIREYEYRRWLEINADRLGAEGVGAEGVEAEGGRQAVGVRPKISN